MLHDEALGVLRSFSRIFPESFKRQSNEFDALRIFLIPTISNNEFRGRLPADQTIILKQSETFDERPRSWPRRSQLLSRACWTFSEAEAPPCVVCPEALCVQAAVRVGK